MAGFDLLHDIKVYDDSGRELLMQKMDTFTWEVSLEDVNFRLYDGASKINRQFHASPFIFDENLNGYVSTVPDGSSYSFHVDMNGRFKVKQEYMDGFFAADCRNFGSGRLAYVEHLMNRFLQSGVMRLVLYSPDSDTYYSLDDMYPGLGMEVLPLLKFRVSEQAFYQDADTDPDYFEYYVSSVEIGGGDALARILNECFYGDGSDPDDPALLVNMAGRQHSLYPFYKIIGSYETEDVSVELISSNTLFFLDKDGRRPRIEAPDGDYAFLTASIPADSELSIISASEETADVKLVKMQAFDLAGDGDEREPLMLPIGFTTDTEGCYENAIELFATAKNFYGEVASYFLGSIYVKSTAIGEDARYRTLFDNFGIPDPVTYPNIFKEQDPDEQGVDYELINRKSKELFLTYDQIFPYVGTYKALINAVRFLGYDDVFFKEWYKIIDNDGKDKAVAFESVSIRDGETLRAKLRRCGVTYEEYLNYRKLNRLSLIYRLNVEDEDHERVQAKSGKDGSDITLFVQNPTTKEVYDYTSDALLAKLYYLKQWLEKYVIGVNCQIQDITGEGVYFHRLKSQIYANRYARFQMDHEASLTPYPVEDFSEMANSEAWVRCSIHEFDNSRIRDYEGYALGWFLDKAVDLSDGEEASAAKLKGDGAYKPSYGTLEPVMLVSAPLEAMSLFDEMSFSLESQSGNGSLAECQENSSPDCPIYVKNNEILIYGDAFESLIDQDNLPIMQLTQANIRNTFGNWDKNIIFSAKIARSKDGKARHMLSRGSKSAILDRGIALRPSPDPSLKPSFKYTHATKWPQPMLVFKNYIFATDDERVNAGDFMLEPDKEYIIEILDGKLLFNAIPSFEDADSTPDPLDVNSRLRIEVDFGFGYDTGTELNEQSVTVSYNYIGQRNRIYSCNTKTSPEQLAALKKSLAAPKLAAQKKEASKKLSYKQEYMRKAWLENELPRLLDPDYDTVKGFAGPRTLAYYAKVRGAAAAEKVLRTVTISYDSNSNIRKFAGCSPAEKDYVEWLFSDEMAGSYIDMRWSSMMAELDRDIYLGFESRWRELCGYGARKEHRIRVNHKGDYKIQAKGYDAYNNAWTATAARSARVDGEAPAIVVCANQPASCNAQDFHPRNTTGTLLSKTASAGGKSVVRACADELVARLPDEPSFPRRYRSFDMEISGGRIEYDAISYAMDTPKEGDTLSLQNLSERATGYARAGSGSGARVSILDENPRDVDIFSPGTAVRLVCYDNKLMKPKALSEPLIVEKSYCQDQDADAAYSDQSWIELPGLSKPEDFIVPGSARHTTFIINVTEYPIEDAWAAEDGTARLLVRASTFKEGHVVKIGLRHADGDGRALQAQTCYRLASAERTEDGKEVLALDGRFAGYPDARDGDEYFVAYANTCPVDYKAKVLGDAQESAGGAPVARKMNSYSYNGINSIHTSLEYDSRSWFAGDYLDGTYTCFVHDYDPSDLMEDWAKEEAASGMELYAYENHPVTIGQGRLVAVTHKAGRGAAEGSYRASWAWRANTMDEYGKSDPELELLYRCQDDAMAVKARYAGRNDIELTAMDRYGNEFVNSFEGLIYVKPS